jgi:hypothetical protein
LARFRYFFTLFLLLVIVGCTTAVPSATPATLDTGQPAATIYPYPEPALETSIPGYPAPMEETKAPTPTTDPTLGNVQGEIYLKGQPVNKALLFLSDVLQDKQGNDSVVSVDLNTKNRVETNPDGSFTFVNIPPQRYALVLVVMPHSYVLLKPDTQDAMVLEVKAGETVSMGRLDYDDLPILLDE